MLGASSLQLQLLRQGVSRWQARWRAKSTQSFRWRVLALFGGCALATLASTAVYRLSSGPDEDWGSSLFTVYAVLWSIPGADITNTESFMAAVALNAIFVFGLLVFATVLAMISDEIGAVMLAARSGRAPLALSGHILLLNWNAQAPFVIQQLEAVQAHGSSHPFAKRPLVVLADREREELDTLVLGLLKGSGLEVHTRCGKPYRLEHLMRVAAQDAAAVLVMHPEAGGGGGGDDDDTGGGAEDGGDGGDDDASTGADTAAACGGGGGGDAGAAALKMQTIMALSSLLAGKQVAMVIQAPDDDSVGLQELDSVLVRAGHPANLMNLPLAKMVSSLAVQTALQPCCASIYTTILGHGLQPSLAFVKVPEALFVLKNAARQQQAAAADRSSSGNIPDRRGSGSLLAAAAANNSSSSIDDATVSFEEARVAVKASLLAIGYVSRGQLHLNPPESSRICPGDTLVTLTMHADAAAGGVQLPLTARVQAAGLKAAAALQQAAPRLGGLLVRPGAAAPAVLPAPPPPGADSSAAGPSKALSGPSSSKDSAGTAAAVPAMQRQAGLGPIAEVPSGEVVAAAAPAAEAAPAALAALPTGAAAEAHTAAAPAEAAAAADGSSEAASGAAPTAAAVAGAAVGNAAAPAPTPPAAAAAADDSTTAAAATASGPASEDRAGPSRRKKAAAAPAPAAAAGGGKCKRSPFACCFAAPAVADDDEAGGAAAGGSSTKAPRLGAAGDKSASFRLGKAMTGAVATVGKGVVGAVTTVADGAAGVVTGAVNTVADGATLVGKTVVSTATAVTDVVSTVADGAVGLGKTVASGAIDGAGFIGKTVASGVTGAVNAPASLLRSSSLSASRAAGSGSAGGGGGLFGGGGGGLFGGGGLGLFGGGAGGGRQLSQATAKALAADRLAHVDVAAARAPPAQPLAVVVAGYSAGEAATELLPHFLSFSPPGSTVTFVVREGSPPPGFEAAGTVEQEEEREDAEPIKHVLHYRFLQSDAPTSSASLAAAGLHGADSVLIAAEAPLRGSPAEADAQVLACLVSIQHLLASQPPPASSHHSSGQPGGGSSSSQAGAGGALLKGVGAVASSVTNVTSMTFRAAGSAVGFATRNLSLNKRAASPGGAGGGSGSEGAAADSSRSRRRKLPHVVACVSTSSSKAVAAAFFGPPAAGAAAADHIPASGSSSSGGARGGGGSGIVGRRLFSYELLVPGEIEGAVLVQTANEALFSKVVHELLVTSEGCELYILAPSAFGFSPGEALSWTEVCEVGRMLRRTVVGVVFTSRQQQQQQGGGQAGSSGGGGGVVLAPDPQWRWSIEDGDRIAVIADSW